MFDIQEIVYKWHNKYPLYYNIDSLYLLSSCYLLFNAFKELLCIISLFKIQNTVSLKKLI